MANPRLPSDAKISLSDKNTTGDTELDSLIANKEAKMLDGQKVYKQSHIVIELKNGTSIINTATQQVQHTGIVLNNRTIYMRNTVDENSMIRSVDNLFNAIGLFQQKKGPVIPAPVTHYIKLTPTPNGHMQENITAADFQDIYTSNVPKCIQEIINKREITLTQPVTSYTSGDLENLRKKFSK